MAKTAAAKAPETKTASGNEFSLKRSTLLDLLEAAATAIQSQKNIIPVLDYALIEIEGGTITVKGTSFDLWRIVTAQIESSLKAKFLMPVKRAIGFLSKSDAEEATIKLEGQFIVLQAGRASAKLATHNLKDFPDQPKIEGEGFDVDAKRFSRMLRSVAYATSNDASRFNLQGVLIQSTKTALVVCSCDGIRIAQAKMTGKTFRPDVTAILPKESVNAAISLAARAETLNFATASNHIFITSSADTIISRTIEGQFPNVDMVLKQMDGNMPEARFNGADFQGAMARLAVAVDNKERYIWGEALEKEIQLFTNETEIGRAEDFLPCQLSGGDFKIYFDANLITPAINSLEGGGGVLRVNREKRTIEIVSSKTEEDDSITVRHLLALINPAKHSTAKKAEKTEDTEG